MNKKKDRCDLFSKDGVLRDTVTVEARLTHLSVLVPETKEDKFFPYLEKVHKIKKNIIIDSSIGFVPKGCNTEYVFVIGDTSKRASDFLNTLEFGQTATLTCVIIRDDDIPMLEEMKPLIIVTKIRKLE